MLRMLRSQYHPTCLIPFLSQVINALSRPASDLRIPAFDVDVLARAVIRPLLPLKFEQNMLSVWTALSSHKRTRAPLFVSILLTEWREALCDNSFRSFDQIWNALVGPHVRQARRRQSEPTTLPVQREQHEVQSPMGRYLERNISYNIVFYMLIRHVNVFRLPTCFSRLPVQPLQLKNTFTCTRSFDTKETT